MHCCFGSVIKQIEFDMEKLLASKHKGCVKNTSHLMPCAFAWSTDNRGFMVVR